LKVEGKVIFERIDHIDHLDYYKANLSIANYSGRSVINADAILYKTWDGRLTVSPLKKHNQLQVNLVLISFRISDTH
jgi:hypothetical protein